MVLNIHSDNMYSLTAHQAYVIWVATLAAACLSMFGSAFMLVTIFLYGKNRGLSRFISFLAFGDWGWAVTVCMSNTILLIDPSLYTTPLCKGFRMLFQFFAMSTVFWTTCISFYLYRSVFLDTRRSSGLENAFSQQKEEKLLTHVFHFISFGIPAAVSLGLITDYKAEPQLKLCYPTKIPHFFLWFLPIICCFVLSVLVYAKLTYKLTKTMSWRFIYQGFRDQSLSLPFRISLYLIVFFLCWVLDVTQFIIATSGVKYDHTAFFYLIVCYNILLQSQGTLDMMVYGIANKEVRRQYNDRKWFCFLMFIVSPVLVVPCMFKCVRRLFKRTHGYDQINN